MLRKPRGSSQPVRLEEVDVQDVKQFLVTLGQSAAVSFSTYSGGRSAVAAFYTWCKFDRAAAFDVGAAASVAAAFTTHILLSLRSQKELTVFMKSVTAHVRDLRDKGESASRKKGAHLPFALVLLLVQHMLLEEGAAGLFAATFLLLLWHLAARPENIATLHLTDFALVDDTVEVGFSHAKTDVTGEKQYPRRVYANPAEDFGNIFLVLGLYLASTARKAHEFLFAGSDPQER